MRDEIVFSNQINNKNNKDSSDTKKKNDRRKQIKKYKLPYLDKNFFMKKKIEKRRKKKIQIINGILKKLQRI